MSFTYSQRFEQITARGEGSGKCPECGKRVKRTRTFSQTVNPFNKREDGVPKTRAEVRGVVQAQADAWSPTPYDLLHEKCLESLTYEQAHAYEKAGRAS